MVGVGVVVVGEIGIGVVDGGGSGVVWFGSVVIADASGPWLRS